MPEKMRKTWYAHRPKTSSAASPPAMQTAIIMPRVTSLLSTSVFLVAFGSKAAMRQYQASVGITKQAVNETDDVNPKKKR
jgi:hypothetical protein